MTYKELMEVVKKYPDCFKQEPQKSKEVEYKFRMWVERQNRDYADKKESIYDR